MKKMSYSLFLPCSLLLVVVGCAGQGVRGGSGEPKEISGDKRVKMDAFRLHEQCLSILPEQAMDYSFKTSEPVNFNIHFHGAAEIEYPVVKEATAGEEGVFTPAVQEVYCLTWDNINFSTVDLSYTYLIRKK